MTDIGHIGHWWERDVATERDVGVGGGERGLGSVAALHFAAYQDAIPVLPPSSPSPFLRPHRKAKAKKAPRDEDLDLDDDYNQASSPCWNHLCLPISPFLLRFYHMRGDPGRYVFKICPNHSAVALHTVFTDPRHYSPFFF